MKTIAIIGSCDTKSAEIMHVKKFIENTGHKVFVIDISIGREQPYPADVPREEIIAASGHEWQAVKDTSKGELMGLITAGAEKLIPELYLQGKFDAVFSMGGLQNTTVAVNVMKKLPIGVPKVMLSTVANGNRTFEPFVGTRDIVLMPSIADISGINTITKMMMENAASCVIGMANHSGKPLGVSDRIVVGTTLMGITNDGVCGAINHLASKGIETIGFHSTGVGGRAMEELVASGTINAVMDLTLHEITSEYFGGGFSYGATNRLTALCQSDIPLLVSLGGLDFIDYPLNDLPRDIDQRKYIHHNEQIAHIKIFKEEGAAVARIVAERLNKSRNAVTLLIPANGLRKNTRPGEPLYDKAVDATIIGTLLENINNEKIIIKHVEANLNEEVFGIAAANEMIKILKRFGKLEANFEKVTKMLGYFDYPYSRPEQLDGDYIIATYLVYGTDSSNILKKAGNFAVGQTVGTWIKIPGVTAEMVEHYQGRILSVHQIPSGEEQVAVLRLAFPLANFAGNFAMMLTALVGNDVSTAIRTKLLDLELSGNAQSAFSGPAQSIDDLRKLTGVYERPLVLNMIKPCTGFSAQEGAKLFYEVALGGVDLIKDDEILGNTGFNCVADRVREYGKAAKNAAEHSGKETIHLVNITDRPARMRDNAKAAIQAGAKGCLINFVFAGIDSLAEICEEFGDKLFIMAHYAGVGVMNWQKGGIANSVYIGLIPRLAGAHAVMTMFAGETNSDDRYDFFKTVQAQRMPMKNIKPTVTAVGGGVTPLNLASIYEDLGKDLIIGVGGAIQGHPGGAACGAKATMSAVNAAVKGISLDEAAASCAHLKAAMDCWR